MHFYKGWWLVLRSTQHIIGHVGDDFYRPDDETNTVKALKETSWSSRSGLNPTRTTPPRYNNTTLGNRLYAWRKGPNVMNQSVGPVRTAYISVLRTVNIVSHNPAQSSSDNILLTSRQSTFPRSKVRLIPYHSMSTAFSSWLDVIVIIIIIIGRWSRWSSLSAASHSTTIEIFLGLVVTNVWWRQDGSTLVDRRQIPKLTQDYTAPRSKMWNFTTKLFSTFRENSKTFLSISRGSRHRKCTFFCANKSQSVKQVKICKKNVENCCKQRL